MPECPNCKTLYGPEDRYCNQCGDRLIEPEFMDSGARTQKSLSLIDVHYDLGLVYFKKGKFQEALEVWEKALSREPGNEMLQERIDEVKARLQKAGWPESGFR